MAQTQTQMRKRVYYRGLNPACTSDLEHGADEVREIRGVVFDMDGTLTVPVLDFKVMRERLQLLPSQDIVETLHSWTGEKRAWGDRVIHDMEHEAMLATQVMDGTDEVVDTLERFKIPKAILTRNHRKPVDYLLQHHLPFDFHPIVTRDWDGPAKPHPAPLLHISSEWNLPSPHLLMVGDSLDDLQTARGAGAVAVFLENEHNGKYRDLVATQGLADVTLRSMRELVGWLERGFVVERASLV
ncbi:HAD-like protein [Gonapodya prolifera JEL478]|uniref:HAD-like protein n=1 Tax=Gonapodya prolifera (strain JEL478) TaxID=1344416 RepID=A0A139AUJ6_GONPJ|nr:HAD-like protein [Gonapodya prolifera JEL478]|eukprot:KXS20374.1 HAD-like protein [Gonapodya prolifera JEL478]